MVLSEILDKVKQERNLVDGDKIRLIVSHPSWSKAWSTKLLTIGSRQLDDCIQFIEYKGVPMNEVKIEVQSFKIPRGNGRLHVTKNNVARKTCIITIKNDDTTCLARAIVTAIANINKTKWTKSQVYNGFNKSRKLQKDEALKLHEEANVEINNFGSTLEDVKTFAEHLNVQINIVDGDQFNTIILSTEEVGDMIYLYKNGNHFDVITSMPGFLCKAYYCHTCKKSYKKRDCHKCPSKCIACFKYFPDGIKCSGDLINCNSCHRSFFGQDCFDEHKRNRGKSDVVCEKVVKCLHCERTITVKDHICGYSTCSNCKSYCNMKSHKCYMTKKQCKGGNCTGCSPDKKCYACKTKTEKYMFYDFECTQETGIHVVNLAVVQDYKGNEYVFNTIDEFCNFVFTEEHKNYTFIAHNSKGYDAQFILKWCVENGQKPYCIYAGTKIMSMEVFKIRFIDSLNFVASTLAAFPKTFGLKELKKGYFPHYFNKECNQNYIGPIPDKEDYGYNQMSCSNRKAFLEWYQEDYVFDFQKEILDYCRSDVDILRRSMMKFREDFIELENIDPLQYVTIASVCMAIYRGNYMPTDTIGVIKDVTCGETYSKISIAWLDWMNQNIQHALRMVVSIR